MEHMRYGWIPPFIAVTIASLYIRAERWKLLIEKENVKVKRSVLFSGVSLAYVVNYAIPRFGEITRCVYVGKRHKMSVSSLIGTVIVERVVDLITLISLVAFVVIYVIADPKTLRQLFGRDVVAWFYHFFSLSNLLEITIALVVIILLGFGIFFFIKWLSTKWEFVAKFWKKGEYFLIMLWDGLKSIKRVRNWPLFILLTAMMWFCYILMTYIPFYMFSNLIHVYHLGFADAMTVTVIAAIGIAIPSPGGMGTYHWFVKQALWVLFSVPPVIGLSYAFITYATIFFVYILSMPIILFISRRLEAGKLETVQISTIFKESQKSQEDPGILEP